AGHYRYAFPQAFGGRDGTNLEMAVIREHLAAKGLGPHCDLQNEHAIVGNNVGLLLMLEYGSEPQRAEWVEALASGTRGFAFGITEPAHGSDATWMETTAVRDGDHWVINGEKTWNTGIHTAAADLVFARTSGSAGDGTGITAFLVPADTPGFTVDEYLWTFNMPTDHAHVSLDGVRVPDGAVFGAEGRGLQVVQHFFNENRIRQAASSLGAAQYSVDQSVAYAKERAPFGQALATNQGIQFPLVELQTQCEMLRAFIHKTAWLMDTEGALSQSDKVSMCNYWANRLCCDAADRAMQVHGGLGYSRHKPFEHIYRHHRRYRITEGAEEIQMGRVAGYLFGFMKDRAPKGVTGAGAARSA
ncbi:MAG: acyl-CoA dehydrogenase family protein, partial [Acidimicrobiales bacterium]